MQPLNFSDISVDKIDTNFLPKKNIEVDVLRLDKIHPIISGNKWFKLKYHLENVSNHNYEGVLTFGGAWSNHILATACYCSQKNISCVGIIRGEKPKQFSKTLLQAQQLGMRLEFLPRNKYQHQTQHPQLEFSNSKYPNFYTINEGGSGLLGEKGMDGILEFVELNHYSHILCAVGTGTMFRGITSLVTAQQAVVGICVLKGMNPYFSEQSNHSILCDYHFGGYAKKTTALLNFMNDFYSRTHIPTDFVYTGKLFFAIEDLLKNDKFPNDSRLLAIHSGGLQGNDSLVQNELLF